MPNEPATASTAVPGSAGSIERGLKMLDDLHHHPRAVQDANLSDSPFSPLPAFVDTGATLIDKSNLDDFIKTRDATMPKQR